MRETCRIAREVIDVAARVIRPGITTDEIDEVVHKETLVVDGYMSPLNYHFFPKSCCTSLNEVICHGIPDARRLEEGDIVNLDVTVYYNGVYGNLNETFFVGKVDESSQQLVRCTYECLEKVISIEKPRVRFHEVGEIINRHASSPRAKHYAYMVDRVGRSGFLAKVEDFINTMPLKPNVVVCIALLGACRAHGNVDIAQRGNKFISLTKATKETIKENGLDAQEPLDHNVDSGDHLFSRDLSHMHPGKSVFGVYNHASTQQYLMCSSRVVWGLWVLGLHEDHTSLELGTTCQAPYLLEEVITFVDLPSDDHVCLFFI